MKTYRQLIDPLMNYTASKFVCNTLQKEAVVRLIYEVIRESIVDLHFGNRKLQKEAIGYFNSDLFVYHCECVAIAPKLMLRIVNNPEQYLAKVADQYYESLCK